MSKYLLILSFVLFTSCVSDKISKEELIQSINKEFINNPIYTEDLNFRRYYWTYDPNSNPQWYFVYEEFTDTERSVQLVDLRKSNSLIYPYDTEIRFYEEETKREAFLQFSESELKKLVSNLEPYKKNKEFVDEDIKKIDENQKKILALLLKRFESIPLNESTDVSRVVYRYNPETKKWVFRHKVK